MKTTLIGGVLFLIPLAFVAIILQKVFELSMMVAAPLERFMPLEGVAGLSTAVLLAILLIVIVCFLAGMAARQAMVSRQVKRLDDILTNVAPGYAVAKALVSGVSGDGGEQTVLKPVLVRFDGYEQIAFKVEMSGEKCTLFLPGAPSVGSGSTVIVRTDRVSDLTLAPHTVVSLMRLLGRGSLVAIAESKQDPS